MIMTCPVSAPLAGTFLCRLTTLVHGAQKGRTRYAASLPIVGRRAPWGPAPIWRCCRIFANERLLGPERPPA